jgi:hypothetical protein
MRLWFLAISVFLAGIGLFVSACGGLPGGGQTGEAVNIPVEDLEVQAISAWLEVNPGGSLAWSATSTPWLPTEWPAERSTVWVKYYYAQGFDPQLADAVRVAAPWARAEASPGEDAARFIPMRTELEEAGIQGVFPLPAEDVDNQESMQADLPPFLWQAGMPTPDTPAEAKLRMAYRLWIRYNRVIADQVKDSHEAFLRWVEMD